MYEFKCEKCGSVIEKIVPVGTEKIECEHCKTEEAKKVLSNTSPPQFKGGGWAKDGYSKGNIK